MKISIAVLFFDRKDAKVRKANKQGVLQRTNIRQLKTHQDFTLPKIKIA